MPVNPTWASQGRTDHPAVLVRMAQAGITTRPTTPGITAPLGGVNAFFGNRLAVTGLASMNVQVDTGLVYLPNSTAWNGMYAAYNTATFNVAIAAASATQWRRDYIVAQMTDPGDNTAAWTAVDVQGAFGSSPGVLPSIPANSVPIGIVNVVPNMTVTNGGGTVTDARIYQPLPGPWYTSSSALPPTSSPDGSLWSEADTDALGVILGGAARYVVTAPGRPDAWTTISPANGWANQGGGLVALQYKRTNDKSNVHLVGVLNPAAMSSAIFCNLPAGFRPTSSAIEGPLGFHTSTGAAAGVFFRCGTTGDCSAINATTGTGGVVVNVMIPLDI